ncbi:MAG: F0F1 ATP synthase subunit B [Planctomycetota bacterium]|nr:F0F1 ATP synthase subunit B [Planctomycetota bacterium]MDI6788068.1 F0F1 ATP synthase subunit B [Planctomycetota bacterium]
MKDLFTALGAQGEVILLLVINFIILFLILKKFLFGRVLEHLDNRRKEIQDTFSKIEEDKKQIARLSEEYQNKLQSIEREGYQKIQDAIKEGLSAKAQIISESHLQTDNILRKAREELELEKKKAMKELRNEIISLSISAAEKVISKQLDGETNSKIVSEFLQEVDKVK